MTEREAQTWKRCIDFYMKWRAVIIETEEQWQAFAAESGQLALDLDVDHNPLGQHLYLGILDTFSDLYRNGMKPVPANYFGRDDL